MFKKNSWIAAAMALGLSSAAQAQSAQLSWASSPEPVQVGQIVNVDLLLTGVQDLYAFQFDLQFDGALLRATSSMEGSLLRNGGETYGTAGTIDNAAGSISNVFYTLVGPVVGVSGSGTLLQLRFATQAVGMSTLTISNALFLDSMGEDIGVTAQSGMVHISAVPEPASLGLLLAGLGLVAWRRRGLRAA